MYLVLDPFLAQSLEEKKPLGFSMIRAIKLSFASDGTSGKPFGNPRMGAGCQGT